MVILRGARDPRAPDSAGCSKMPSSKAAASEEARRTLRYVEPLSAARTPLEDFFSILLGSIEPDARAGSASMDLKELRQLTAPELEEKTKQLTQELFNLRF